MSADPAIVPVRAIIYVRVSRDSSGTARSITEQEAECRADCERLGWPVAEVVSDNSAPASQYSRRVRPGFARLQKLLQAGDALVAWEASRVTRRGWEAEELLDLCAERGVLLRYSGTTYDPSKPVDRLTLRVTGATAAHEVDQTRERVLRDVRKRVNAGTPHGRMPYGYRRRVIDDRTGAAEYILDPEQAPIVREIAQRSLRGETIYNICKVLNERGVTPSSRGGSHPAPEKWVPRRIRVMMQSPTYAGKRVHRGKVTGDATWPAIITEDEHARLVAIYTDPERFKYMRRGSEPAHLLSGIAVCGECGKALRHFGPQKRKPVYRCPDNHVTRRVDKVDEKVIDAMLQLLSDPLVQAGLREPKTTEHGAALDKARELRQRLEGFYAKAADGDLTPAALAAIEARLLPQIEAAEKAGRQPFRASALANLVSDSEASADGDKRAVWESYPLEVRRDAIRAALVVRVIPQPPLGRVWDPQYVQVSWRLD